MQRMCGFTLPEILMTLAVMTLLSFIAAPLTDMISSVRTRHFSDQLYALIQQTRLHAMTQRKRVTLCPLSPDGQCTHDWNMALVSFEDANGNRRLDPTEKPLANLDAIRGLDLKWAGMGDGRSLHFNGLGITAVTNGRFTLCRNGLAKREIVLNRQGRLRSQAASNSPC
ncbi:MAG: GspH/FimT family pseudopilin [Pseudomonas sp.]